MSQYWTHSEQKPARFVCIYIVQVGVGVWGGGGGGHVVPLPLVASSICGQRYPVYGRSPELLDGENKR